MQGHGHLDRLGVRSEFIILFDYGAKIGKAKHQAQEQQQEDETECGDAEQISVCDNRDEPGPNGPTTRRSS